MPERESASQDLYPSGYRDDHRFVIASPRYRNSSGAKNAEGGAAICLLSFGALSAFQAYTDRLPRPFAKHVSYDGIRTDGKGSRSDREAWCEAPARRDTELKASSNHGLKVARRPTTACNDRSESASQDPYPSGYRGDGRFVVASPRCRNVLDVGIPRRGRGNLPFSLIKLW